MLPEIGITTTMVGNALGISSHDLGTLCTYRDINMHSKYKPIHYPFSGGMTQDIYAAYSYGWVLPDKGSISNQMSGWVNNPSSYGWYVKTPTGGSTSPFRLGDFRGYDHLARGPLFTMDSDDDFTQKTAQFNLSIRTSSALNLGDFVKLEPGTSTYYGICIIKQGATSGKYATMGAGGSITIDKTLFAQFFPSYGTYNIYTYVTKLIGLNYNTAASDYIPPNAYYVWRLPIEPKAVTYSYAEPEILFTTSIGYTMVDFGSTPYKLTYEIRAKNNKGYTQRFESKDLRVDYYYGTAGHGVTGAPIKFYSQDVAGNASIYIQTEVSTEIHKYYDLKQEKIPLTITVYYKDEEGKVILADESTSEWGWQNGEVPKD